MAMAREGLLLKPEKARGQPLKHLVKKEAPLMVVVVLALALRVLEVKHQESDDDGGRDKMKTEVERGKVKQREKGLLLSIALMQRVVSVW